MEKQANKSNKFLMKIWFIGILFFVKNFTYAQTNDFVKGKTYILDSISVSGIKTFNEQTVISYSGLTVGEKIKVPGEKVSAMINKLWALELFSDINVFVTKINKNNISLELEIVELPTLTEVKINGLQKSKIDAIIKDTDLVEGKKLSESFLTNTKNYIINKYQKEGFLDTKVSLNTIKDSVGTNSYKMVVNIDRGPKIKIKDINFVGNDIFKQNKLKSKLKNTKSKNPIRFWKRSKYIENDFKEDLVGLIDFYKEQGYRDARLLSDTVIRNDKRIKIHISEFRNRRR